MDRNILTKERKFDVCPYLKKWLANSPLVLKKFLEEENRYLKSNIKPESTILDVGCGFGRNIKVVAKNAKKIIGLDYDKKVLEVAKKNLKQCNSVELFLENAKKMHFKDNVFDYVICMGNTFGNMLSIKSKVLEEMKRVIRKDGKIIISVFSEDASNTQIKGLEAAGFEILRFKNNMIYTKQGLVSEAFTKLQLKKIFDFANLKASIIKLTPISYLCEITKG